MARGDLTYWAAEPVEEAVRQVDDRVEAYYNVIRSSRILDLWRAAHWACYAGQRTGGNLGIAGEAGELTTIELNEYGNLKQHVLNFVTGQRPAWESKAINTDHRSSTQTILANSLIDTVMRERGMEDVAQTVADYALQYGEGFCVPTWDANLGQEFAADEEGNIIRTGDVTFDALMPTDVCRDIMRDTNKDWEWVTTRSWESRYELMARYPELAEDISDVPGKYETEDRRPRIVSRQWMQTTGIMQTDELPVWTFFHRRCDALPHGRMIVYLTSDIVLYDGTLPYREIPVYRMAATDIHGTVWGYTMMHDLLAPQYAVNALASTLVSNAAVFGVQNIWVPAGSNLTWKEIRGGLNMVEGGVQPPQPLQLLQSSPETYKLMELLQRTMETLSGVNSVARGNPESSLKSGAALALVQAQAIQFQALTQKAYLHFLEKVATAVLRMYQDFATMPHLVTIVGEGNREYTKEFKNEDIDSIDRVTVTMGSPLMATVAGRYNMAEMLVSSGVIHDIGQLNMVLSTGRLEALTKGPEKERLNISSENERLAQGINCQAIITDNHPMHIQENSTVLDSPESRENAAVVQAVVQHLLSHQQLWETAPPSILAAKGIPPPPMPMMPGMGPSPGGDANPPGGAKTQGKPGEMPGTPVPGSPPGGNGAKMPGMPKNPLTGQKANAGAPQPAMPGMGVS